MTFIRKIKPKRTCKDFKPSFWDRDRCKLTEICSDTFPLAAKLGNVSTSETPGLHQSGRLTIAVLPCDRHA